MTADRTVPTMIRCDAREDDDLRRRVGLFLARTGRRPLRDLVIETHGDAVTLRGAVASFYERQLALACVARVAGVRSIVDCIQIAPQRPFALPATAKPAAAAPRQNYLCLPKGAVP